MSKKCLNVIYIPGIFPLKTILEIKNKAKELFTDLLIGGICYYRTRKKGDNIDLEILNPIDTFVERNPNEFYLNKACLKYISKTLKLVILNY